MTRYKWIYGAVEGECVETGKTKFQDGKIWNVVTGGTSRIGELVGGIQQFYNVTREDEMDVYSSEIGIVNFMAMQLALWTLQILNDKRNYGL